MNDDAEQDLRPSPRRTPGWTPRETPPRGDEPLKERTVIDIESQNTVNLHVVCDTDVGRERTENQDAWGFVDLDGVFFLIVCDGMGGHNGGSTASRLAVQTIEQTLEAEQGDIPARMTAAISKANLRIFQWARRDPALYGMGTTVVLLAMDRQSGFAHLAHVGDSRAYLLRDNVFERLTRDHTMVQRLVDDGLLTPEAAENHPHSNIISRSLGGGETVEVEHHPDPISMRNGDIFLLCSDGLTGMVPESFVPRYLARHGIDDLPKVLIDESNAQGGLDNITVGLALVGDPPEPRTNYQLVTPKILRGRKPHETSQTIRALDETARTRPNTLTGPAGQTLMIPTPAEGIPVPTHPQDSSAGPAVPPPGADVSAIAPPGPQPARRSRDLMLLLVIAGLGALVIGVAALLFLR
ncbi:MAG: hypothetical protein EA398_10895 [Deltaproteobacteria bacterium]|nr:MAG: hypothetical protein EA398_10895 [Deltaproteobacteria bacterium]